TVQRYSDDAALKRIQAARAARKFPLLFPALADGRLHLTAICLLAPHLTVDNAQELVAAATHQRSAAIERMLAQRDVRLETMGAAPANGEHMGAGALAKATLMVPQHAARHVAPSPPPRTESHLASALGRASSSSHPVAPAPEPRVTVALEKRVHDKLQYARALLSHSLPSESQVIERALDDLIAKAEKTKFSATTRPLGPRRGAFRRR